MSIKKKIKILIKKYQYFLVGFSGGIDSTVLLHELYLQSLKNKIHIRAIHINHNINKYSNKWSKHCKKICKKLNIKLIIKKIDILIKNNIECSLRKIRYNIYKKNKLNKEIILTAHHKNDQCESFFLALKRGSGPKGLSGIKKKIKINKKIIIYRPLLKINKKKIKKYAVEKKLIWIKDNSNTNIDFDRNFLRLLIIKKIVKKWPYFLSSVYRSAKICLEQEKILNYLLKKKTKKIIYKNTLNFKKILKLKKNIAFLIIRKWINLNNKLMISYKLINYIWKKFIKLNNKTYFQIFLKEFLINKYKNTLYLTKKYKNINKKTFLWKNIKKKFYLPYGNGYLKINVNKKKTKKSIRQPKKNELVYIKFNIKNRINIKNKKKKIKKIWQEKKIFPWERKYIPIIFYNKIPISCPNIFITENGKSNKKLSLIIKWIKKK